MSAATTRWVTSAKCLVLTSSPENQDLWGEGGWWGGGEDHAISCGAHLSLLLPPVSAEWHLCQLLPKGVTLVKCHRLQHEWWFSILHFSPCCLSSIPQVPFFILKGHHLQIQVWGDKSNYILSSGFPLRKPPNHLWLKHRDYSRGKMLLVAALPASLSWFHPPLFSHANGDDDSEADCSAALGGLRPFSQQRSSVSLNVTQGVSGRLTWICSWASLTPEPCL